MSDDSSIAAGRYEFSDMTEPPSVKSRADVSLSMFSSLNADSYGFDNISAAEDVKIRVHRSTEKNPDHRLERMHIFFFFHPIFRVPERKTLIFGVFSVGVLSCFARAFIGRNPNIRVRRPVHLLRKSIGGIARRAILYNHPPHDFPPARTHPIIRGHRVFFSESEYIFVFSLFFIPVRFLRFNCIIYGYIIISKKCRLIDINKICTAAECEMPTFY